MINIRKGVFETNSSSSHSLVIAADYDGNAKAKDLDYDVALYSFYGDDEENGILAVGFGEYGWDGDPLTSFRDKLAYLLTQNVRGYGKHYYGSATDAYSENADIRIKSQADWDEVIDKYVSKDPYILKVFDVIKAKCPNIKGFKFLWYNPKNMTDLEDDYEDYLYEKDPEGYARPNRRADRRLPAFDDPFFNKFENDNKYRICFGYVDHQSSGLVYRFDDIENFLFNDSLWVIITNDNR